MKTIYESAKAYVGATFRTTIKVESGVVKLYYDGTNPSDGPFTMLDGDVIEINVDARGNQQVPLLYRVTLYR
jgi:hypothetical protein